MNKKEQISFYKAELRDIENSKLVLEQSISAITRRESTLKSALMKLESKVPQKKESVLTPKQVVDLLARLTK